MTNIRYVYHLTLLKNTLCTMLPLKYLVDTLSLVSVLWRFLVLLSCTALHMPSRQISKRTCFESFVLATRVDNQSYEAKNPPQFHHIYNPSPCENFEVRFARRTWRARWSRSTRKTSLTAPRLFSIAHIEMQS